MKLHKAGGPYLKAVRRISRLQEIEGQIPNKDAFDILCAHFLSGVSTDDLSDRYLKPGQNKTQVQKLCSHNEGKEAARRRTIRSIFFEMCEEMEVTLDVVRIEHSSVQGSRGGPKPRKPPSARPFLRTLGGAVRGSDAQTGAKKNTKR